jgi:hypothetical protein
MRDGDDAQENAIYAVDKREWETVHRKPSVPGVKWLPDIRGITKEFRKPLRFRQ